MRKRITSSKRREYDIRHQLSPAEQLKWDRKQAAKKTADAYRKRREQLRKRHERTNRFKAAKIKHTATDVVRLFTTKAMREGVTFRWGVPLRFDWYCANKRTDPDNVAFQHKFVFDGMMAAGFLENDNWAHIVELNDRFFIDKKRPRVEVYEIGE